MAGGSTDMARMKTFISNALASLALIGSAIATAAAPPAAPPTSVPGIDTPELAALGPDKVGFRRLVLRRRQGSYPIAVNIISCP